MNALFPSYPTNDSASLFAVSWDQDVAYDGTFKAIGFHILYPIVLFFKANSYTLYPILANYY